MTATTCPPTTTDQPERRKTPKRSRTWRRQPDLLRVLLVPALLLLVVSVHTVDRQRQDLSPWKGGGFAMFSTIDSPNQRILRLQLHTDEGAITVAPPQALSSEVSAALAAPSEDRLIELSILAGRLRWVEPRVEAGLAGELSEDEALRQFTTEALRVVSPATVVQAVADDLFDPTIHQDLVVQGVTISVHRLMANGPSRLEPVPLRSVSIEAGSAAGGERP